MNRFLTLTTCRKSASSQIINSTVWAAIMIVSSLIIGDVQTQEFLVMMYIAGWFVTTMPGSKYNKKK